MADAVTVYNGITNYGYRLIHIMREKERPRLGDHLGMVPEYARRDVRFAGSPDKELKGVFHLEMWWKPRERAKFPVEVCHIYGGLEGVLWRLEEGEEVGPAINPAAELFNKEFGSVANVVLSRWKIKATPLPTSPLATPGERSLRFMVEPWVPMMCLFLIREEEIDEPGNR